MTLKSEEQTKNHHACSRAGLPRAAPETLARERHLGHIDPERAQSVHRRVGDAAAHAAVGHHFNCLVRQPRSSRMTLSRSRSRQDAFAVGLGEGLFAVRSWIRRAI